jgi:hypothetical protein
MKRLFLQAIFLVLVSQVLLIQPQVVRADELTQRKIEALERLMAVMDMVNFVKANTDMLVESGMQSFRVAGADADPRVLKLLKESLREVIGENADGLGVKMAIIYHELFTYEEILELIRFYETPIGKKWIGVMPAFYQKTMAAAEAWHEDLKGELRQRFNEKAKAEGIEEMVLSYDFVFVPYVTEDRKQGFKFVAMNNPPSTHKDVDPETLHKTMISNELTKRQYCLEGWEIVSKTADKEYIIYEGACK